MAKRVHEELNEITRIAERVDTRVGDMRDELGLMDLSFKSPAIKRFINAYQDHLDKRLSALIAHLSVIFGLDESTRRKLVERINRVRLFISLIGLHHVKSCLEPESE